MKYHKDGLERDLAKMKIEGRKVWHGLADERQRFTKDRDGHAYVELYVAANRISAWFMGHIDAFVWPLFITQWFVIGFLAYKLAKLTG